ncbi:hypothetical protein [Spiroplasma endosymbiont of Aleiodes alternator]|uniref:hypothetical protein n=1 Tax=Spiroplasma endosymbiont of Aleiodes alternator TaxID=3139329 RepID=UPI003CCAF481
MNKEKSQTKISHLDRLKLKISPNKKAAALKILWVAATQVFRKELTKEITISKQLLGLEKECLQSVVVLNCINKDFKQIIWTKNISLPLDELCLSFGMYKLSVTLKNPNKEESNYFGLLNTNDKSEETIVYELLFDGKWFKINDIESSNMNLAERLKYKINELESNLECDSDFDDIEKKEISAIDLQTQSSTVKSKLNLPNL